MHDNTVLVKYFPKDVKGQSYDDIGCIYNEYVTDNNQWMSEWCDKNNECTEPTKVGKRLGLRFMSDKDVNVSIEDAINLFLSSNQGSYFVDSITLTWPLSKSVDSPFYTFISDLGNVVKIDAYNASSSNYFRTDCSASFPKQITLHLNNEIKIRIRSNETTGYHWEIVPDDSGVYEVTKVEYVPDSAAMGAPGWKEFTIKGVNVGSGMVTFQFFAPGKTEPEEECMVKVQVIE